MCPTTRPGFNGRVRSFTPSGSPTAAPRPGPRFLAPALVLALGWALQRQRVTAQQLAASLEGEGYAFTLPPQLVSSTLALAAGDARDRARIERLRKREEDPGPRRDHQIASAAVDIPAGGFVILSQDA